MYVFVESECKIVCLKAWVETLEKGVRCGWWCAKEEEKKSKRTTPGIPTWSPTVVLTGPDNA
jgi:hypothetical protein